MSHLDGISVTADDWHMNVRPSNTEPLLRLNLEALDRSSWSGSATRCSPSSRAELVTVPPATFAQRAPRGTVAAKAVPGEGSERVCEQRHGEVT